MADPAPLIVAIDGPSGVGKSTVAKRLARRLGVPYLDTGAMYRALGLKVLEAGVDPEDAAAVEELLETTEVSLEEGSGPEVSVLLDGDPVEDRIRTPEVGQAASTVAAHAVVRRRMVTLQRRCGEARGGVLEGRDIGSKVFPGTPYKFFLDARPEVRAERRYQQLLARGDAGGKPPRREEILAQITRRDARDRGRGDSPLTCDSSYIRVDASDLGVEAVVDVILGQLRPRVGAGPPTDPVPGPSAG